jgi:hypothetical protein
MKTVRIMGSIAFGGYLDPDPDGAAEALRRAGFEVTMMPEEFRPHLAHPKDYFMEAAIDGGTEKDKVVSAVMDEINTIVERYGGLCCECGLIPSDWVPFEDVFKLPNRVN